MKSIGSDSILWFEPDDNRRQRGATLRADGTLCFGKEMREKIGGRIKVGFWSDECTLMIQTGSESGFAIRKNGEVRLTRMASQLMNMDLELPLSFLFYQEKKNDCWQGYIVPPPKNVRRRAVRKPVITEDYKAVLNAYKWLIDRAVYQYAKSTPIDERRAAACEALIEALHIYTPLHGTLRDFLSKHIKNRLLEHNKQFTGINQYNSFSLDAPIRIDEENSTCFHEILSVNSISIIDEIERKADMELFCDRYLDKREKRVFIMLNNGYTELEISEQFCMTSLELSNLCSSIGERWKEFNKE
jgi:hypothetical protein